MTDPTTRDDDLAALDAHRYRKLRSIGAAPNGTNCLKEGTVLVASNLDDWLDASSIHDPGHRDGSLVPASEVASLRADRDSWRRVAERLTQEKDGAYEERNKVVAALARLFPSGLRKTNIPGWSDDWHGCVMIDLPTGQVSWHYHDSQALLFADLPHYTGEWDGHDTPEKYRRLAALASRAPVGEEDVARAGDILAEMFPRHHGPQGALTSGEIEYRREAGRRVLALLNPTARPQDDAAWVRRGGDDMVVVSGPAWPLPQDDAARPGDLGVREARKRANELVDNLLEAERDLENPPYGSFHPHGQLARERNAAREAIVEALARPSDPAPAPRDGSVTEAPTPPDAPVWYSAETASAWESGWSTGYEAALRANPPETRAGEEAQRARAEAFDDAAAIMRRCGENGQTLVVPSDWVKASYTFSNEAYLIRQRLASPPAEGRSDGWQDIGTAPKDGRSFLVWNRENGIRKAMWYERSSHDLGISLFRSDGVNTFKGGLQPTHWRPLPPPPSTDEARPSSTGRA